VSLGVLFAVVVGFALVAVASFKLIHGNLIGPGSKLKPVEVIGPQQTVFRWRTEACEPRDIPDTPARAYRDAHGEVHLISSHYVNRAMTGPDLSHVKRRCPVIMRSTYDPRPGEFADHEWIASTYTTEGTTVFALVHDEYQGNEHPGRCPSGVYLKCWYNAVTLARSSDGGASFHHARVPPGHLVAEIPYRYTPDAGPYGVFQPSNILHSSKDRYYYALAYVNRYRAQEPGTCVMRTKDLADPSSWRAWNGDEFGARFVDPYVVRAAASRDHLCKPVSSNEIETMSLSLTYSTYFDKYLLVGTAGKYSPRKRKTVWGFYYSLSDDLIHWTQRKLIREAEMTWTYRCGDADPVAYPSVLDPSSKSRNFETTGRRPYLYFTRFHYSSCRQTLDRDLVRVPIQLSK
jgi:hypothetical protein